MTLILAVKGQDGVWKYLTLSDLKSLEEEARRREEGETGGEEEGEEEDLEDDMGEDEEDEVQEVHANESLSLIHI